MVSVEGIATIMENDYRHLDKCSVVARVGLVGLNIIL